MGAVEEADLPSFRLDGRRALITGGGRGIGRACALALAQAGADVAVTSRTGAQLDEVVAAVEALGGRALAIPTDVGDTDGASLLLEKLTESWPEGADILVNNAAISPHVDAVERLDDDAWSDIFRVNLDGTVRVTRAVCASMLTRKSGAVVNITSIGATRALPRIAAYNASKGALEALTKTMAVEWAARGVRVNAVAPAYVDTEMTAEVKRRDKLRRWVEDRTPMGRFGRPEEVAWPVVFLCSDAAAYLTGTTLYVDGGWTAG